MSLVQVVSSHTIIGCRKQNGDAIGKGGAFGQEASRFDPYPLDRPLRV